MRHPDGRVEHRAGSRGSTLHTTANGAGSLPVVHRLCWEGAGGPCHAPSMNTINSPTSTSLSGRCRILSAASSSEAAPGYVPRASFSYGAPTAEWRVLRACRRGGGPLRREVTDPSRVSRITSPIDTSLPVRLQGWHSFKNP